MFVDCKLVCILYDPSVKSMEEHWWSVRQSEYESIICI
jgi:hypothetical protein